MTQICANHSRTTKNFAENKNFLTQLLPFLSTFWCQKLESLPEKKLQCRKNANTLSKKNEQLRIEAERVQAEMRRFNQKRTLRRSWIWKSEHCKQEKADVAVPHLSWRSSNGESARCRECSIRRHQSHWCICPKDNREKNSLTMKKKTAGTRSRESQRRIEFLDPQRCGGSQ